MKSAQQWHDDLLAQMNRPPTFAYCSASVDDIKLIQADALRSALLLVVSYHDCHPDSLLDAIGLQIEELERNNKSEIYDP